MQNTMFGLYDMFTGGSLSRITIFALGVMPYISALIILQLLTVVWPYLERLSKEGELDAGRSPVHALPDAGARDRAVARDRDLARAQTEIAGGLPLVYDPGWGFRLLCVLTLTTGTMFIMWLGEQITERGIGNGMSLIIFAGIVVGFPRALSADVRPDADRPDQPAARAVPGGDDGRRGRRDRYVERGHRRITVQYAKRVVGRRQYGGTSTHIPLKVNTGGVIPVIFASSILAFPATMSGRCSRRAAGATRWSASSTNGMPLYNLLYVLGSSSLRISTQRSSSTRMTSRRTCAIRRVHSRDRPGKRTAEYIDTILARVTLVGAVYLALVALLPNFLISGFRVAPIPFIGEQLDAMMPQWITKGLGVPFYFGGTSLLIVVGVAMDAVNQVESQLIMRHYDGFMKKTRIRGRRG